MSTCEPETCLPARPLPIEATTVALTATWHKRQHQRCHASRSSRCSHLLLTCRILDNLPVAIVRLREDNGQPFKTYERGYPVGRMEVCHCA